ncbi:MAG: DUF1028 domain-containing protein, partial [Bacteroidota bacterium]
MSRFLFLFFLSGMILLSSFDMQAQVFKKDEPFAHTFSIVARDAKTGQMAVGVQSHWFSVGTIVSWGKSGVGVVATQSFVNPAFGPEGLDLMEKGVPTEEALVMMLQKDEGKDFRQLAMIDTKGNAVAFTGEKCIAYASHHIGENYSIQANMMDNAKVVPEMVKAYEKNADLPLAERVVAAMIAGQEAGGDIRGKQSAVLLVVDGSPAEYAWQDKLIDLRVDDHETPIKELERLLKTHRAYEFMNKGDVAVEQGNMEKALEYYGAAQRMIPSNLEMKYWTAVALANNGQMEEAKPIFQSVFKEDPKWRELTERLPASGLLRLPKSEIS